MNKILADMHTHTIASGHAYATLTEMCKEAANKGLEIYGITEHSSGIPGTCADIYFQNLRVIPRDLFGLDLRLGAEINIIDYNGTLDLGQEYIDRLDFVIAGIHSVCYKFGSKEENTAAIINAIKNPNVNIISHPDDGRCPLDYEALVQAAPAVAHEAFDGLRAGLEADFHRADDRFLAVFALVVHVERRLRLEDHPFHRAGVAHQADLALVGVRPGQARAGLDGALGDRRHLFVHDLGESLIDVPFGGQRQRGVLPDVPGLRRENREGDLRAVVGLGRELDLHRNVYVAVHLRILGMDDLHDLHAADADERQRDGGHYPIFESVQRFHNAFRVKLFDNLLESVLVVELLAVELERDRELAVLEVGDDVVRPLDPQLVGQRLGVQVAFDLARGNLEGVGREGHVAVRKLEAGHPVVLDVDREAQRAEEVELLRHVDSVDVHRVVLEDLADAVFYVVGARVVGRHTVRDILAARERRAGRRAREYQCVFFHGFCFLWLSLAVQYPVDSDPEETGPVGADVAELL